MVEFRNVTSSRFELTNWWDNGNHQIAFGRGDLGFLVVNREDTQRLNRSLQTGMPEGRYCDIVNGEFNKVTEQCTGPIVSVGTNGLATFDVDSIGASAIHVGAKLPDSDPDGPLWQDAFFRGTPNGWATSSMAFSQLVD